MLKPTRRVLLVLRLVRAEAIRAGWYGSKLRVASQLGITRQAIDDILSRHRHRLSVLQGLDRWYGLCRVCGAEFPAGLGGSGLCRDCAEQRLRRCACGTVGRWLGRGVYRCPDCALELQRKFHSQHPGYQRRYRKTRGSGKKTRGVISR